MAVIYQITNTETGDFYVGSATSFRRRKWQHLYDLKRGVHKNPRMQAAFNAYGEQAFSFEIIEELAPNEDQAVVENEYLQQCVGQPDCYNVNKDAQLHRLGQILSQETRDKISRSRTGKAAGPDHHRYGKKLSKEIREKISATQKGRPSPMKGKKMSEQGRANVAAAVKRGPDSPFYGKRPTNADDLQKAVRVQFPDGSTEVFQSFTHLRDTFGVSIATLIRAAKGDHLITRGVFAGHMISYADKDAPVVDSVPEEYADLPRTRTEAKALGAKKYFTGKPCTHGHVAPRYTKGVCVVCAAEEQRAKGRK